MIFNTLMFVALVFPAVNETGTEATIDSILAKRYQVEDITPLPQCSDLQFLRRVTLDLVGRIPTTREIRRFSKNPDRTALIDRLLDSPEFDRFLSESWTAWLIGYSNVFQTDREMFRIWLEEQISTGVSFREIVHQLISARGSVAIDGPVNYLVRHRDQPAVNVARSFLGVRLECAQCHDHPFDRWTEDDYERMSRFFSTMRIGDRSGALELSDAFSELNEEDRPRFLTGSIPRTSQLRDELALYVTNCKPFARTYANRVWYFLMGRGVIDPPDDHNLENRPVDAELFEHLTQIATENEFQIKPLFRRICNSRAYGRLSATEATERKSVKLFAARQVKPLVPEQYVSSMAIATGRTYQPRERRQMVQQLVGQQRLTEDYQRTWEYRETVQQLMEKVATEIPVVEQPNVWRQYVEKTIGSSTTESGETDVDAGQQTAIEAAYLRILTRRPTEGELERCRGHDMEDIVFALVFGNEFFFNH